MNKRDLILVIYINVGKMDMAQASRYCHACKKNIQDRTEDYTVFYVPVRSGETRIECINPVLMDKKEYDTKVKSVLTEYQLRVEDFITNSQKKVAAKKTPTPKEVKSTPKKSANKK